MGRLTPPALAPGPLRVLNEALHDLHQRAGRPSVRTLAEDLGAGTYNRIFDVFRSPRLPSWGLVELLVENLASRIRDTAPEAEVARFHQLWLSADGGTPSSTPTSISVLNGLQEAVLRSVTVEIFSHPQGNKRMRHGCGFLARDEIIVTANWLAPPEARIEVRDSETETIHQAINIQNEPINPNPGPEQSGLAVLRLTKSLLPRKVSLATQPPPLGSRLATAHYTQNSTSDFEMRLSEVVGSGESAIRIRVDGIGQKGVMPRGITIGGAPVADLATGEIVGIVCNYDPDSGLFMVVPAARIRQLRNPYNRPGYWYEDFSPGPQSLPRVGDA